MNLIAVINKSTVVTNDELSAMVTAVNAQLIEDFCPAWHLPTCFCYMGVEAIVPDYVPKVYLFDTADEAGALGYHAETPQGLPYSKVFVKTTIDDGESVSTVLSHEVLEMCLDPSCERMLPNKAGDAYAVEACDAVQREYYVKRGIDVSNFVLPAYFVEGSSANWDFMGSLLAPFTIAPGGYSIVMQGGQYVQLNGHSRFAPHPASRFSQRGKALLRKGKTC